jgi:glycosyltransferase involved in cell wall biosynthesis
MDTMRPKILLLFEYGTLNGGEFSLLAILETLGQTEFEFVAAAPPGGMLTARLQPLGIQVLPLMLRDSQDHKRPLAQVNALLKDLVTRVSPDLVHANSLSMARMVGRVASQLPMPCTAHLRDIVKLNRTAIDDLNRHAALIAVSHATREFHVRQGMDPAKVQVIYNGVDTNLFCPVPATGTLKHELGLPDNAILLANIGQICLRKGQTLLARAVVSLARDFPQINALFLGERHSQKQESVEYEKTIHHVFQEAGLEDRLFCMGFREDVPTLLNEIDLLVHTARQEPLGRVLLEAAACARAIVATNVGGTEEILTDQVSALLVRPNDLEALTSAIRRMLTDRELRNRLGHQARAVAIEKFSLPGAAKKLHQFWRAFL